MTPPGAAKKRAYAGLQTYGYWASVGERIRSFPIQDSTGSAKWQYQNEENSSTGRSKAKRNTTQRVVFLFGADYWTRTSDLMRVKHAL